MNLKRAVMKYAGFMREYFPIIIIATLLLAVGRRVLPGIQEIGP
jgi:hypothetical protein